MIESGWIKHPQYGHVYQPDLAKARAGAHEEYDAWTGHSYDTLSAVLDDVQYAATRSALLEVLAVMNGRKIGPEQIRAMLDRLSVQQHEGGAGS